MCLVILPKLSLLSFFNCMSCRFRYLWSVWGRSSVFEVLYWTFYHPDLKEEKGESAWNTPGIAEKPHSASRYHLPPRWQARWQGLRGGACHWNREGKETQQGAGTKNIYTVARERGGKRREKNDTRWYKVKVFLGTEGAVRCSFSVSVWKRAHIQRKYTTCHRITSTWTKMRTRQSDVHCTVTIVFLFRPALFLPPKGESWCVTDSHRQLGWTQHTLGRPPR